MLWQDFVKIAKFAIACGFFFFCLLHVRWGGGGLSIFHITCRGVMTFLLSLKGVQKRLFCFMMDLAGPPSGREKRVLISYSWAVYMEILFGVEVRRTTVMFLGLTFWPTKCGWHMQVTSEELTTA